MTIRGQFLAFVGLLLALLATPGAKAEASQAGRIQAALDKWVAERAPVEKITGAAAYVSFGDPGPAIEVFAGKVGRDPADPPVGRNTLFQMGSTSKSFCAAVILKLEAAGKLSLDDTIGRWLPQYPAWKDVSIRRLLNMTSGIPNYSETETISGAWVSEPTRDLTAGELVEIVYPAGANALPPSPGYHYSNTNYILASMIAENAADRSYRDLVHEMVIDALGLDSTFYENGTYPESVVHRLAHGAFDNPACAEYQPNCKESWNLPLIGRDVRGMSTSWAQAAGGAIASARDVDLWMRAVFEGRVVPPTQQAEWMALVSTRTGQPIADVSADDPRGFSLGLAKGILGPFGPQWFYQGTTLGYRTLYVWFEKENLMITVQTNSQPDDDANKLSDAVTAIYEVVRSDAKRDRNRQVRLPAAGFRSIARRRSDLRAPAICGRLGLRVESRARLRSRPCRTACPPHPLSPPALSPPSPMSLQRRGTPAPIRSASARMRRKASGSILSSRTPSFIRSRPPAPPAAVPAGRRRMSSSRILPAGSSPRRRRI